MYRNLYGEGKVKQTQPPGDKDLEDKKALFKVYKEIEYGVDIKDSVLYLMGEIGEYSSLDVISRVRTILKNREDNDESPINIIVNSGGGCAYEMFGIIDYIKSLKVPVNVIVRGRAMSAAAMVLVSATGKRYASKHSTIMIHEGNSINAGKASDLKAAGKHIQNIENMCNNLLAASTKKDAKWWEENTRNDLYLTAEEALELGVIDQII
tara:strand:+ start:770 stop:1396 length:627 start_codon:yes stop_codon:yes gene_type:complete